MSNAKVSVLIYVKNDELHIEKCVRSVMEQSLCDIEILIIDGGSTDGTLGRIKALKAEDGRIRLIFSPPGVGIQFNIGLKAAGGKYIGICESDDYVASDMYEKQYEIAEKYQLDVLKANVNRFCEGGEKEYRFPFSLSNDLTVYDRLINPEEDFRFIKLGVNGFWSGLYRREFLLGNNIYMNETDGAAYQDTAFSFLSGVWAKRSYVMHEAFYCYRMDNPNSSVNNPGKLSLLNNEYNLLKDRLKTAGLWQKYKEVYLSWKISGCLWFYDNLSDEMKRDYISLFYKDIRKENSEEGYSGKELSAKEQIVCRLGNQSFDVFKEYVRSFDSVRVEMEERLRQLDLKKDFLIFGIGNMGVLVNQYLKERGKSAAACLDNNFEKWGTSFEDLLVMSPEKAVEKYGGAVYLVANASHENEMKVQLLELGVPATDIILCNNYDNFLKKILIKTIKISEASNREEKYD